MYILLICKIFTVCRHTSRIMQSAPIKLYASVWFVVVVWGGATKSSQSCAAAVFCASGTRRDASVDPHGWGWQLSAPDIFLPTVLVGCGCWVHVPLIPLHVCCGSHVKRQVHSRGQSNATGQRIFFFSPPSGQSTIRLLSKLRQSQQNVVSVISLYFFVFLKSHLSFRGKKEDLWCNVCSKIYHQLQSRLTL